MLSNRLFLLMIMLCSLSDIQSMDLGYMTLTPDNTRITDTNETLSLFDRNTNTPLHKQIKHSQEETFIHTPQNLPPSKQYGSSPKPRWIAEKPIFLTKETVDCVELFNYIEAELPDECPDFLLDDNPPAILTTNPCQTNQQHRFDQIENAIKKTLEPATQPTHSYAQNTYKEMIKKNCLYPTQEMNRIKQKSDCYQTLLFTEKTACLNALKELHLINETNWLRCLDDVNIMSAFIINCINNTLPNALQENILSPENKNTLSKQLTKHGLNFNKIGIVENKNISLHNNNIVTIKNFVTIYKDMRSRLIVNNPQIEITAFLFAQLSPSEQKGILISVAWNLIGMGCTDVPLAYFLFQYSKKKQSYYAIRKSKEYVDFLHTLFKQSKILPFLEDYSAPTQHLIKLYLGGSAFEQNRKEQLQDLLAIKKLCAKRTTILELTKKPIL